MTRIFEICNKLNILQIFLQIFVWNIN